MVPRGGWLTTLLAGPGLGLGLALASGLGLGLRVEQGTREDQGPFLTMHVPLVVLFIRWVGLVMITRLGLEAGLGVAAVVVVLAAGLGVTVTTCCTSGEGLAAGLGGGLDGGLCLRTGMPVKGLEAGAGVAAVLGLGLGGSGLGLG